MGLGSFLEDVDKANLPQRVGALTKGLSDIQQLETNKIQQKNYLADIEVKERAARLADYEWQKIQEEEAWQKKKFKVNDLFGISPSDVPDNMRFPKAGEGFKNWAIDFAQKSRLAEVNPQTGELEISIENHARAIKMFGENMEIQKDGLIAALADVSKNLSIAEASLPEIKKPGDRKKAEEDIADMKMMKNAITEQVNILDTELRGKLELEKVKSDIKEGAGGKIPIQSDKIQVAMAELGIDPANPASYTPENISLAGARLRKREADERAMRNEEITAPQRASIAHNLRTELRQDKYVQDFKDVDNKYQVMERAISKAGTKPESYVAVDQALITLYNKMTDPTSVVRESEYARTGQNMSVANSILGKLDKWKQGGAGLTDVERNALVEMAREFHKGYAVNYDQIVSDFEQTAKESGIDPKLIGIPYKRKSFTKDEKSTQVKQKEDPLGIR